MPDDPPGWAIYLDLLIHPTPEVWWFAGLLSLCLARCLRLTRYVPGLEELIWPDDPSDPPKPAVRDPEV